MKNKKAILRKEADKLWYLNYLKERCEICGSNYGLQGHHFYYKGSYGHLRYDKDNHITLCMKCHFILHHQDPKTITEKIIEKRGKVWYNRLQARARNRPEGSFLTIAWFKGHIDRLREYLKAE